MRVMPYWPFSELIPLNDIDQYLSWVYRFEISISQSPTKIWTYTLDDLVQLTVIVNFSVLALLVYDWLMELSRWLSGKESACQAEMRVRSLGQKDPLEEGMATHSSILTWKIPWTEEPGGLWSIGSTKSQRWLSGWTTKTGLVSNSYLKCRELMRMKIRHCQSKDQMTVNSTVWINVKHKLE